MSLTEAEIMIAQQPRVTPWSEEAEQAVLGALLLDNDAFDLVTDLISQGDFYARQHRLIFGAIAQMLAQHAVADVISVFQHLQDAGQAEECGGLVYLNALAQGVHSAVNARRHSQIVREKSTRRTLIAAADQAGTLAWDAASTGEALDGIAGLFAALQAKTVRKLPRRLAEIAIERSQHYEDLEAGRVEAGWRTHIPRLTSMLTGGFRRGGFYVIAARPSVGKSSFAADLSINLAGDDRPVLFLSQEMPDTEVADRAVANVGEVNFSSLLSGKLGEGDWSRVADAMERIAGRPLYIDDQASLMLRDIRAKARSVPGLCVLVVDYLQLCSSSRRDGNRNAEIEEISRGLKTLAKEMGIAVVALSQLNRDVEKRTGRRPILADLRDSGAIEQDADAVIFLWPVRDGHGGSRIIGCGIDKNRQGPTGEFGLDFHGPTQRWAESDEDIQPPKKGGGRDL